MFTEQNSEFTGEDLKLANAAVEKIMEQLKAEMPNQHLLNIEKAAHDAVSNNWKPEGNTVESLSKLP